MGKKNFVRYFHKPCTLETGISKNRMNCLLDINIQCSPLIGRTRPGKCPSRGIRGSSSDTSKKWTGNLQGAGRIQEARLQIWPVSLSRCFSCHLADATFVPGPFGGGERHGPQPVQPTGVLLHLPLQVQSRDFLACSNLPLNSPTN